MFPCDRAAISFSQLNIWRAVVEGESIEYDSNTVEISDNAGGFSYSLDYGEPYPPGEYEVIAFVETNKSKPLIQTFTVQE